jgi:hypothetical protein
MQSLKILEKLPTAVEYNWLRSQVGWGTYHEGVIDKALPNTLMGKEAFYERYGFTIRPTDKFGAGMTMIWQQE